MKTLDNKAIQNCASNKNVYDRGYNLFCEDAVKKIKIKDQKNGTFILEGEIRGSMGNAYHAKAVIAPWAKDREDTILGYTCECPANENYPGACKHVAALFFEYNYQYEDVEVYELFNEAAQDAQEGANGGEGQKRSVSLSSQRTGSALGKKSGQARASDVALKELLDYYVLQDRNQFCQEHGNGDVRLEPLLHLESDRESLELKIGVTQMYVVKDIGGLVDNIKQMRFFSYGKKLAFTHSQSAFTRESTGLVNLLFELDAESEYSFRYPGWSYSNPQMRRSCTLSPAMLDQLMELYEGSALSVDDQLTGTVEAVSIVRENPRLPLRIQGVELDGKGANVEMDPIFLTEGGKQWYILWNHRFYICTREYYDKAKSFLKLMAQGREEINNRHYYMRYRDYGMELSNPSFFLGEQDFGAFAKNVLPMILDVFDVQISRVEFSSYEPQEAVFRNYLDKVGEHVECKAKVSYGEKEYDVAKIAAKDEAGRDIRSEFQVRTVLEAYFELADDQVTYISKKEDSMLEFLERGLHELEAVSEVFATDRFKNMRVIQMPKVTTGVSMKGNLLDVSWDVEGMSAGEVMDILSDYKKKKKYHKLKTGEFLRMDENSLAVLAELNEGLQLTKEQLKNKRAQAPLFRALYLDALMKDNSEYIRMERDKKFKTIVREMRSMEDGDNKIPAQIKAVLRPYQEIGFQWLCTLSKYGFGGILADDMGLGKTLQVLTFIAAHPGTHALVVCPSSLVYNWEAESQKFYPDARVQAVAGNAKTRQSQIEEWETYDILITSYDLLKRDIDFYCGKGFDYMIADEAQYIKNASTQAAKSVKSITCGCRFALTGTPVENRLSELWSIFEFLMPGYLFSYKRFKEELEAPIAESGEEAARLRLSRMVKPFILRRLKKDVLKELPDKIEKVVYAKLEKKQCSLYQAREKQLLMTLAKQTEAEFKTQKLQILAELTALRQICCDPGLIYENYTEEPAKVRTCVEVVENAVGGGHKILLFSQFAAMLERLSTLLTEHGIKVFVLTGKTKKEERRSLVSRFQDGQADVFLISLKAGGTGLNLTAADMVIHYDPWWNLAAQNQATDRAYRIGQDNKVTVLRLIMKGTIEERILSMQENKQNLADSIMSEDGVSISGLDKEQLMAALLDGE